MTEPIFKEPYEMTEAEVANLTEEEFHLLLEKIVKRPTPPILWKVLEDMHTIGGGKA